MIKGSEFIGSAVINTNNELLNYYVKELIYSSKKSKVLGLLVHKHIKSKEIKVIQYKKIKAFRENGIVITSEKDILLPQQIPEIEEGLKESASIISFEIYGVNGDLVGIVKDTIIDLKTGEIAGLIVSKGVLTDIVDGYGIIPLSNRIDFRKKNMIVDNSCFQHTLMHQRGGLKKMFGIEHEN